MIHYRKGLIGVIATVALLIGSVASGSTAYTLGKLISDDIDTVTDTTRRKKNTKYRSGERKNEFY